MRWRRATTRDTVSLMIARIAAALLVVGVAVAGAAAQAVRPAPAGGEPPHESADARTITSPGGSVEADITVEGGKIMYALRHRGREAVAGTAYQLAFADDDAPAETLTVIGVERLARDATYTMPFGKRSTVRDQCAVLVLRLRDDHEPRPRLYDVEVRAYDDGLAFRYRLPRQVGPGHLEVVDEGTTFVVAGDAEAWALPAKNMHSHYERKYLTTKAAELPEDVTYGLPLLAHLPDGPWVALAESNLLDHAATYLGLENGEAGEATFVAQLSPPYPPPDETGQVSPAATRAASTRPAVVAELPHDAPWRVILVGDEPGRLVESDLVQTLAEPSRIADTSWIKPGKISFLWWNGYVVGDDAGFEGDLNTATLKHYIDFAAESGIPYVSIDGFDHAWYGGPNAPWRGADITTPVDDLDLDELFAHARQKGVRIRFWVNSNALRQHMAEAIPLWAEWGIEGVMADFVERDDQEGVEWVRELVELCAQHELTVTLHNNPKPTGLTRTYPNLLSLEAVLNLEYNKFPRNRLGPSTPEHELIVPFVRMLAGPLDFHSGGFRAVRPEDFEARRIAPPVIGTRSRALAMYVVYENPMPMVADFPAAYRGQPGFKFLCEVPTTWDETRVLAGEVGRHIVIARRHGADWYVGAMTDGSPRELTVPLDFLGQGQWRATGWQDAPADADPNEAVAVDRPVTAADTLHIPMETAGGYAVKLSPIAADDAPAR